MVRLPWTTPSSEPKIILSWYFAARGEVMRVAESSFGTGQVLWGMFWFFMFFIWIWVLIIVFGDIFRSRDLAGWAKALWIFFVVVLPWIGVLSYMIVRGSQMHERT